MANDVNSAGGNSRFSQIGAASSMDEIFARAARESEVNTVAGARLRRQGVAERQRIRSLQQSYELFNTALGADPNNEGLQQAISQNRDEYAASLERRRQIADRFHQEKQFATVRGQNALVSQIQTFTGGRAQTSRINEVFNSSAAMEEAARGTSRTSFTSFEAQAADAARRSRELAVNLREAAGRGAGQDELRMLGGQLSESERQQGVARRGMALARKMGLDPESQFERINQTSIRASNRIENAEISSRAESAGLGDIKALQQGIADTAKELQDLSKSFKEGKMGLEEFNKKAGDAADKLERLEKEEDAARKAFGDKLGAGRAAVGAAGALINAAQTGLIDAPIESLRNRAGYAARQNEQYATLKAAMNGDMSAFTLLDSGAFRDASQFSNMMRDRQMGVQAARTTAVAVDAGIDVAQDVADSATIAKFGGGNVAAGIRTGATVVKGAAAVAQNAADMAYEVTSGRTGLNAYDAALDTYKQVNAVPSQFRQAYRDYTVGGVQAGRFAGAGREALAGQLDSQEFIDQMKALRIDPNQAVSFIGQGLQQQGSVFNTGQISAARNMERAGFGDMAENMRRFGALANAGAQNPQEAMGTILEEAVSRGMDSSKAVSMIADATAQSAAATAARTGVDSTSAVAQLIGAGIGQRGGRNEVAALSATMSAKDMVNNQLTDTQVSWGTQIRQTRLARMGMSTTEAAASANMGIDEIAVLNRATRSGASAQDTNKAQEIINRRGLGGLTDAQGNIDTKKVGQFLNVQKEFLQMGGGAMTAALFDPQTQAGARKVDELRAKGVSEDEIRKRVGKEAYFAAQQISGLATGGGNTFEQSRLREGLTDSTPISNNKASGIMNGTAGIGPKAAAGEQIATQGTQIAAEEINAGRKGLGGGVEEFAKKMSALEQMINPETMQKFATAAEQAANNMGTSVENIGNLGESAKLLTEKFDALNKAVEASATFINEKVNSLKNMVPKGFNIPQPPSNQGRSRPGERK